MGLMGHRENQIRQATEVDTKVFYGENLFVGNLAKRVNPVSYHAYHEVITTDYLSLSEGLPPEPTSPLARRGGSPPGGPGIGIVELSEGVIRCVTL